MTQHTHHPRLISLAVIAFLLAFSVTSYAETATYMYDELNRLVRVQYDDGSVVQYTYDGAGNRLQIQTPDLIPPTTTASPSGGLYNTNKSVTLTCDDGTGGSGCDKIYYTTNGITPTVSSTVYSSPINITATTTLEFFANDRNGNAETVKSQTYTIDKTAPTGTIRVNSGATYTTSTSASLALTCSDANGCSQMQLSNNPCTTFSAPEAYANTRAWTLTSGDGGKYVCVKFQDAAGNWSVAANSGWIYLDTTPPNGTLTINSGAAATNSTTVTLSVYCTDATSTCNRVGLSNDNVTFSEYAGNEFPRPWTLPSGDGTKTIYSKFRDSVGNWSASSGKTILLETAPPTTTASPVGGAYSSAQSVTLTCSDGAGSGCSKIYYTTNGSTPTTSSPVYSSSLNITTTTTLKYFAKDVAGNSEAVKTQTYTMDTTAPTGSISINSGAAWTNTVDVTLALTCSDSNGCSQMQFSDDNVTYSTPEAYGATKSRSLSTGDGSKAVYVKFSDTPGNWSTAYSGTIQLDTTAPATSASPAEGTYSSSQSVSLTCDDGAGSGCDKIYYTTDGTTPTLSSSVYSSPITVSSTTTLKFLARDVAGNSEAVQSRTYTIEGS